MASTARCEPLHPQTDGHTRPDGVMAFPVFRSALALLSVIMEAIEQGVALAIHNPLSEWYDYVSPYVGVCGSTTAGGRSGEPGSSESERQHATAPLCCSDHVCTVRRCVQRRKLRRWECVQIAYIGSHRTGGGNCDARASLAGCPHEQPSAHRDGYSLADRYDQARDGNVHRDTDGSPPGEPDP